MNIIGSFSELCMRDYNLTHLFAMDQKWGEGQCFVMEKARPSNALLLLCGCDAVYEDAMSKKVIRVPCGKLFFIPCGARYRWIFSNCSGRVTAKLFEFALANETGAALRINEAAGILEGGDTVINSLLFDAVISEFSKPAFSPSRSKASAYTLLSVIAEENDKRRLLKGNVQCIYNGIEYLRNDPKQEKSIASIAAMCNVSTHYFERLFKEYAGCSPIEYRRRRRIERAKLMLASGAMSIRQISEEIGFEDCAYFCRVFKELCGCTPSQYRATYLRIKV